MERLTKKNWQCLDPWECCGQDEYCERTAHGEGGCTGGCIVPELYAKLGQYEDTGLAPEEVLTAHEMARVYSCIEENKAYRALEIPIDRLKELAEADKEGRVEMLPDIEVKP
mgnify:FL=1